MLKTSEITVGSVFERLTVVEVLPKLKGERQHLKVRCLCGVEKVLKAYSLGHVGSCGCLNIDSVIARNTKHGQYGTRAYRIWIGMCNRARNEGQAEGYVERGMCPTWGIFETFLSDMGECPSDRHTLDRVDGLKGYSKSNCRWATYAEQMRNKSSNVIVLYKGQPMCLADAAILLDVDQKNLRSRLWNPTRKQRALSIKTALGPEFSWPKGVHYYSKELDE